MKYIKTMSLSFCQMLFVLFDISLSSILQGSLERSLLFQLLKLIQKLQLL
eukprot:m.115288 g.115288  ORF g.115288 m.115288 type:complete len:50 (-) comp9288_c2_seq2:542-691(-)